MRLSTVASKDQKTQQRSKQTEPAGEGILILVQTQTTLNSVTLFFFFLQKQIDR